MFQHNIIVKGNQHIQIQAILETKAESGGSHIICKSCRQITALKKIIIKKKFLLWVIFLMLYHNQFFLTAETESQTGGKGRWCEPQPTQAYLTLLCNVVTQAKLEIPGAAIVSPCHEAQTKLHWASSFRCFRSSLFQKCSFGSLH